MRRYMNCYAIPYFILVVFDLVLPELTTCYLQNVIVEGLGVITQICYAKSNFMHLIRASTFALLDLELNRVMYLSRYTQRTAYMLSVLLAYYLLNFWVWYGFCVYQQLGYVVYRRVLKYYSGEEDGLGNCKFLSSKRTGWREYEFLFFFFFDRLHHHLFFCFVGCCWGV
jgi:hypothetical protein